MNFAGQKKVRNLLIVLVNVISVLALVLAFVLYDNAYKVKLYNQNVDDISNINQSSANMSSYFFSSRESKLKDIALYIEKNKLSLADTLDFIYNCNSDKTKHFEIIDEAYQGCLIEKNDSEAYEAIDYSGDYENIQKIVDANKQSIPTEDEIFFVSEFTGNATGVKCFGQYTYLMLPDEDGGYSPYTLMLLSKSDEFTDLLNLNSGYTELATTIVNENGNYIIGNIHFKSDNFFQYLYVFNDLNLDEKNEIRDQMLNRKKGSLEYLDSAGRKNVFVYTRVPESNWYCITAVPVSLFHNKGFDLSFTLIVSISLLALLIMDSLYLFLMNRRLKVSVENERIASAAKTDFLSRMSHDIRTPLNVIIGMALLAKNEKNPPETKECLNNIDESGKFLLGLVNDILDLNKVESGKMELHPEPYCYSEFCGHINAVVKPLCQSKSITFVMNGEMPDQYVMLDRLRINQIFFNLLSNAVKFTPSGGKVELNCSAKMLENKRVAFDFEVRDNGIGMSREFQSHMFEAFSQEQRKETFLVQGTGLGLAIVSNLIQLMDGQIRVESEEGKGTSFFVHLESCLVEYQDKKVEETIEDDILYGKRVLLCEDHPLNAKIAMKLLERKNVTVEHASDGEVGVSMFKAAPLHYYDAILMDIRMPVMDGMEATRAIRALDKEGAKDIPIIAMTANAYDIDKKNSRDAGMNEHIAKPIDPAILYATLERQIAKSR